MAEKQRTSDHASLAPGLYIVATPIGNLQDITARAQHIIRETDILLCEDTRVTGKLLMALGLKAVMKPYHDHNGHEMRPKVLDWLAHGYRVALVSDAGTPLISDPGYKLVADVANAGHRVIPIPGPSALTAALSVAGLPTDRILFVGFPPSKSSARKSWFKDMADIPATLVIYESTRRLPACLIDAADCLGPRSATVCREMTKTFENSVRGDLVSLSETYRRDGAPKGECVVVISPPEKTRNSAARFDTQKLLSALIASHGVKGASNLAAEITGLNKKALYTEAQAIKDKLA